MRLVVTFAFACLVAATFLGCTTDGNNWQGGSDLGSGPTAASLLFVQPTDGQVGLRYGERQTLSVRLGRGVGATFQPVFGQEVRFAISGDPKGSALASDRAFTDNLGFASVDLTAGQLEATYTIAVSSTIAATIEFSVSVSKNQFLDLDVVIAAPTAIVSGSTARGLLYMDRTCSALSPSTTPPPPLRQLAGVAATSQTLLPFRNLLAQDYALVGRLDDDQGKLLAWRCLDLPLEVVTTAGIPKLVVPLEIVLPTLGGRFVLEGTAASTDDELLPLAPWRSLVQCPLDPAEHLYTRLLAALEPANPTLAATLAAARKVPSTGGCRPNITSPDQALAIALTGGPADALASVVADLTTFAGSVHFETELDLQPLTTSPSAALQYGGTHKARLARLFDANGDSFDIDLVKEGWFVGAVPLSVVRDSTSIVSTEHTLPFGLPYLWRLALERHTFAARLPALDSAAGATLVAAVLDQATAAGDLHGCEAIAAIVCDQPSDRPAVVAACEGLPLSLGAELDLAFVPTTSPSIHIEATVNDSNGDLIVDTIKPGALSTSDGRLIPITGSLLQ